MERVHWDPLAVTDDYCGPYRRPKVKVSIHWADSGLTVTVKAPPHGEDSWFTGTVCVPHRKTECETWEDAYRALKKAGLNSEIAMLVRDRLAIEYETTYTKIGAIP